MQCYNKVDQISLEEVDRLAHQPYSIVISCELDLNLDFLLSQLWEYLSLLRVYTKRRGGTGWMGGEGRRRVEEQRVT